MKKILSGFVVFVLVCSGSAFAVNIIDTFPAIGFQTTWNLSAVSITTSNVSWQIVSNATTGLPTPPATDGYIAQLRRDAGIAGTSIAYTGSLTDGNYTLEAWAVLPYQDPIDYNYVGLFAHFMPPALGPITYTRLHSDFSLDRYRLRLQTYNAGWVAHTTWYYPADFPDPGATGWHHLRLSCLGGNLRVWLNGQHLPDPLPYTALTTGFVACFNYYNVTGVYDAYFEDFKVYDAQMIMVSPSVKTINHGTAQIFGASGGTPANFSWSVIPPSAGNLNTSSGATVTFTATSTIGVITATIQVTETGQPGHFGTAQVIIQGVAALSVSPVGPIQLSPGATKEFTASGGTGNYTWSLSPDNVGSINTTAGTTVTFSAISAGSVDLIVDEPGPPAQQKTVAITVIPTSAPLFEEVQDRKYIRFELFD
ncbi:MAG: hypothetical protein QME64_12725 [bacterium]|nr:hypothetical protein [bacterium]